MSDVRVHRSFGSAAHSCCSTTSGIVAFGDADAVRHPQHVPIDREPGHAERVTEHDVRGLAADAGQLGERVHVGRHLAAVLFDERLRHAEQRLRLRAEEAGRMNLRLELAGVGSGERARVGIPLEQRRRDHVDALHRSTAPRGSSPPAARTALR